MNRQQREEQDDWAPEMGFARREFPMTSADFTTIIRLLREATGIALCPMKRDLVYGRLSRRLRALELASFSEYLDLVQGEAGGPEFGRMVNALTTNLTGFFREPHHFEDLRMRILPCLAARPSRRLRIWSAGCSSGEEPYSIAMTLALGLPDLASWDARILATDIDTEMIERAAIGRYDAARCASIPGPARQRFLQPVEGDHVEVVPEIKALIRFKPLNLFEAWPMRGPFDVIFCRNVVIYFDKPARRDLFDRFARLLTPEGTLIIGHSESLLGISDRFQCLGRTIYQRIR